MRGFVFAGAALLCSACLQPHSCVELFQCPADGVWPSEAGARVEAGVTESTEVRDAAATSTQVESSVDPDAQSAVEAGSSGNEGRSDDAGSGASFNDAGDGGVIADGSVVDASDVTSDDPRVVQLAAGAEHTCALLDNGHVRCWGRGSEGQLGYGNTNTIGDDETPASTGDVKLGGSVVQLAAGGEHTCALLDNGHVRCWGRGSEGRLGYGNTNVIGDDETPASAGDVNVGGTVVSLAAGTAHTCALLDNGRVRCWGAGALSYGRVGQLGYGNINHIGDDETPASAGDVNVGGIVVQLAAGDAHTCALLDSGRVRCWGMAGYGSLGYGNTNNIGDDEAPATAGDVPVGGTVGSVAAGTYHTVGLLDDGRVRCWGNGGGGRLGYGNTNHIGDDEASELAGDVNVGAAVVTLAAGGSHTCALLNGGRVRCWGVGLNGQLGYGSTNTIGDDEHPASAGDVNVDGTVMRLVAGSGHTCVLLDNGHVRCWGGNASGQLGYGNTDNVGDDEAPATAGDVNIGY